MFVSLLFYVFLFSKACSASSNHVAAPVHVKRVPYGTPSPAEVSEIYFFDDTETKLSNIAARANGALLVTLAAPKAGIYQVSPENKHEPVLVAKVENATAIAGITEIKNDVFAFSSGYYKFSEEDSSVVVGYNSSTPDQSKGEDLWTIDLKDIPHDESLQNSGPLNLPIKHVIYVDGSGPMTGLAPVPRKTMGDDPLAFIAADSSSSTVYVIDVKEGKNTTQYELFQDGLVKIPGKIPSTRVNTLRWRSDTLWAWTAYLFAFEIEEDGEIPKHKKGDKKGLYKTKFEVHRGSNTSSGFDVSPVGYLSKEDAEEDSYQAFEFSESRVSRLRDDEESKNTVVDVSIIPEGSLDGVVTGVFGRGDEGKVHGWMYVVVNGEEGAAVKKVDLLDWFEHDYNPNDDVSSATRGTFSLGLSILAVSVALACSFV